jgi:sulfate permease, SulP family
VSRSDTAVYAFTLAATLLAPLEYAVFIGVFLSIALYLRKASRLHVAQMVQEGGSFTERPMTERLGSERVMLLQFEGDLFFAVADELRERLGQIARSSVTRAVVVRLKRTHWIDASALEVLEEFARHMRKTGRHVLLCGIRPELMTILDRYGLTKAIGKENVFPSALGVFGSAKLALQRARDLVEPNPKRDAEMYEI